MGCLSSKKNKKADQLIVLQPDKSFIMKHIFLLFQLFLVITVVQAQEVPGSMRFAEMEIDFNRSGKADVEKDVASLKKNEKYFNTHVAKADIFFPVVEAIFRDKGFPDDFKYLLVQESAFEPDAVSKSNAVGYWQFKEATAKELGLRVDNLIDERKNIVSSSRAAADYMTKNNKKLDNWLYALLSYHLGPTGVLKEVKDKYRGKDEMNITGSTHWYIKRTIAHKIAYGPAVNRTDSSLHLIVDSTMAGKSLKDVARYYEVPLSELVHYNKWIKPHKNIPDDKPYFVAVPVIGERAEKLANKHYDEGLVEQREQHKENSFEEHQEEHSIRLDDIKHTNTFYTVNGKRAIIAIEGDDVSRLAMKGDIKKKRFLRYNEIESFTRIEPGQTYFLEKKGRKATVPFHTVQPGETLWSISQDYGMRTNVIRRKNRMDKRETVVPGRVLWLQDKRPFDEPVEFEDLDHPDIEYNFGSPDSLTEDAIIHKVKEGETLFKISKRYNVEIDKIVRANDLLHKELETGMEIYIPKVNRDNKGVHVVVPGDTLYSIARKYNVSVEDLKEWNDINENDLSVGKRLIVNGR